MPKIRDVPIHLGDVRRLHVSVFDGGRSLLLRMDFGAQRPLSNVELVLPSEVASALMKLLQAYHSQLCWPDVKISPFLVKS